jgi:glyoxylase-like metal-dependent hydrolase (beta-lactamase superfamily II)
MLNVKVFTFNPVQENTYVLFNENKSAIIIDPGCYFDEEKSILEQYIHTNKLQVKQLINTHCHLDHVFGNKWVHETFGVELYLHFNEKMMLEYAPTSGNQWGLPFENYNGPLHFLQEGSTIFLDDDKLEIFLTPGHSPGSLCFYAAKEAFVIGGDVLFRNSIGRTDLPGGNYTALINSIKENLWPLPNDTVVYSGHGPSTTIGYEKRNNPFLQD